MSHTYQYKLQIQWGESWRDEGVWVVGPKNGLMYADLFIEDDMLRGIISYTGEAPFQFKAKHLNSSTGGSVYRVMLRQGNPNWCQVPDWFLSDRIVPIYGLLVGSRDEGKTLEGFIIYANEPEIRRPFKATKSE